jgi:hypothetical protein
MSVIGGNLRNKVDLYGGVPYTNSLGEKGTKPQKIKSLFVWFLPAQLTGSTLAQPTGTEYSTVQQRVRCRKRSIPDLNTGMYFMYQGIRYDVEYFQPDFKEDEYWDIFVKSKLE